jgi:LytTr DNA-binding domain
MTSLARPSFDGLHFLRGPSITPPALFFGLVPALIGCLLGATQAGLALHLPWMLGILFWVLASLGVWVCLYAGTSLVSLVLRRFRPSLVVVLLVGALVGSLPARYVVFGIAQGFADQMANGRAPRTAPPFEMSVEFWLYYLQGWSGVFLVWLAAGVVFARLYGVPRYSQARPTAIVPPIAPAPDCAAVSDAGTAANDAAGTEPALPTGHAQPAPLIQRLPEKIGTHVIALEAEDHYVRVHTDRGSTLLLARLGDAIRDLGAVPGMRVHRSYWVRQDAVMKVSSHGKGWSLNLTTGIEIPVSQSYKAVVRNAGFAPPR